MLTGTDNPSAKWVRSREACRDFGEPGALKIAGSWLKNCISQHAGNCAHQSNFRPRRLIDTAIYGPSEVVKLDADTPLVDVPYATLSYCWGGDQDGKTLRANLALRMQGFNLTDQPKTIQDAITITRALGIRFVWVDSLCIVQDDDDDKVHEITRMHDIYRHSSLTISASRATSSQEGFLSLCKPVDPIRLGYRGPDGTLGSVILSSSYQFREPIHSRAWTLQEHSLSARLLIFGTFGMRWVCRAGKLTDGEQENASHIRNILAEHLLDPQSALNPVGEWQDVVLGYSARALTNVEDRLPALSAMATMNCAARSDDQYLAGLWMSSLPRDLLWHVSSGVNWRGAKRDQHAGFPSWSWASVTGPIEGFIPPGRDEVVTLKAINSEVELRNASAPFGQVSHGKLTLEGRLFVVRGSADHALNQTSTSDEPPRLFQTAVVHVQSCGPEWEDDTRDTATFDVTMDEPESIGMLDGCYCLEVISNPNNLRTSTGLLLRLTDNYEKTFTRIGHYTPRFPRVSTSIISWAERLTIDIV